MIQKNLTGVYSDEIFKEQNKLIEEQILSLQIAKSDESLAKYNLESIVKFMQEKFNNLGRTYQMSNLSQIRVLLCSIFPSGMVWSYPGYSNTSISPLYQSIRMFEDDSITSGGEGGIRTRGSLRHGGLVNLCTRPLCDLSIVLLEYYRSTICV